MDVIWQSICGLILVIEIALLAVFISGRLRRRKINEAAWYIVSVFALNYALHFIPYVYGVVELGDDSNFLLGIVDCIGPAIKLFVGEPNVEGVADFASRFPAFSYGYFLGVLIAISTTVSAAIEAFGNTVVNSVRLSSAMKKDACDVVVGNSPMALRYAKSCNAVLLLDDSVSRETVKELIEDGYVVLRKGFTTGLFKHKVFNQSTRYNVVCTDETRAIEYINTFITYKKSEVTTKNVYLYVDVEEDKAENLRREIIEKSGFGAVINTFCANELLARTFVEEHPVTKYLPKDYIEDAAVKSGTEISVYMLGFGKPNRELYRQYVMNNQLVYFDGEYKTLPIRYYLCDKNVDESDWKVKGLAETLGKLEENKGDYCTLPELPCITEVMDGCPSSLAVLNAIKNQVQKGNGYTVVIVDTEDDSRNIEIGAKLATMLYGDKNYHVFVRSEAEYTEDSDEMTYFGKLESVFTHDVIVNDSLSFIAKKLNEVYAAHDMSEEKGSPDFAERVRKKAEEDWNGFDHFTRYSNIYAAANLRVKLNLLGLDYKKEGESTNAALVSERHGHKGQYTFDEYLEKSVRNALLAQEHARWNSYYLFNEFLPLKKSRISERSNDGIKVKFNTKNMVAKKHACLTTYRGLTDLSNYLSSRTNGKCPPADYDYYIYDELLITSVGELFDSLGYSVIEK